MATETGKLKLDIHWHWATQNWSGCYVSLSSLF